jgi:inner membrane protein
VALLLLRSTLKKVFLGRTLDVDAMNGAIPADATGEIVEDIAPPATGTIKYAGSFWQATAEVPLSKGTIVRIVEKTNLTVKVAPVTPQGDC